MDATPTTPTQDKPAINTPTQEMDTAPTTPGKPPEQPPTNATQDTPTIDASAQDTSVQDASSQGTPTPTQDKPAINTPTQEMDTAPTTPGKPPEQPPTNATKDTPTTDASAQDTSAQDASSQGTPTQDKPAINTPTQEMDTAPTTPGKPPEQPPTNATQDTPTTDASAQDTPAQDASSQGTPTPTQDKPAINTPTQEMDTAPTTPGKPPEQPPTDAKQDTSTTDVSAQDTSVQDMSAQDTSMQGMPTHDKPAQDTPLQNMPTQEESAKMLKKKRKPWTRQVPKGTKASRKSPRGAGNTRGKEHETNVAVLEYAQSLKSSGKKPSKDARGLLTPGGSGGRMRMFGTHWSFQKNWTPKWFDWDNPDRMESNMGMIFSIDDLPSEMLEVCSDDESDYSDSDESDIALEEASDEDEDMEESKEKDTAEEAPTIDKGSALFNIKDLEEFIEALVCPECADKKMQDELDAFADFLKEKGLDKDELDRYLEEYRSTSSKISPPDCPSITCNMSHMGIASKIELNCSAHQKIAELTPRGADKFYNTKSDSGYAHERLDWYENNIKFVFACLILGGGATEAATILGFLDLPNATSFKGYAFGKIEERVGTFLRKVALEAIKEGREEEIKATLDNKHAIWEAEGKVGTEPMTYSEYCAKVKAGTLTKDEYPKLTIAYDMGWQKRGSGNKYDSLSGHAFMIGGHTGKIIHAIVIGKICKKCEGARNNDKDPKPHDCPGEYEGSSKGMEVLGILKLVIDMYDKKNIIIENIVSDDDTTMKAVLKHSYEDREKYEDGFIWPRNKPPRKYPSRKGQKKGSRGQLPYHIPEPEFLADPTHRIKTVSGRFFSLVKPPGPFPGSSLADALRLKKYFGYWLMQNRNKTYEEMKNTKDAPLLHLFNDHSQCGPWCPRKRDPTIPKGQYYRCKTKDSKLWAKFNELWAPFFTDERIKEMNHMFHTQGNESLNMMIAILAPKHKTYSTTMSLTNRVLIAAGVKNWGFERFWKEIFEEVGITLTPTTDRYLGEIENRRLRMAEHKKKKSVKLKRSQKVIEQIKQEAAKVQKDKRKKFAYKTGSAVEVEEEEAEASPAAGAAAAAAARDLAEFAGASSSGENTGVKTSEQKQTSKNSTDDDVAACAVLDSMPFKNEDEPETVDYELVDHVL